jgi:hypothetical protein
MHVDPQEFGRLEGKVEALKEQLDANTAKLDDIHAFVQQQKGAANILLVVCTAISAVVGWVVSYFAK